MGEGLSSFTGRRSVSWVWVLLGLLCLCPALIGCQDDKSSKVDKTSITIPNKDDVEMVLIPAGEFIMGDEDEKTAHSVHLDVYYIDKYPVTNARYKSFMEATGHPAPLYLDDVRFNQPNHPVVGVSWNDANAYAKWAEKRLPTEAEWEKAVRGGLIGKKYPWGDEPPDRTLANFGGNERGTTPVGKYPPNGFGLYDMSGNVYNWCADGYRWDYYKNSPRNNPQGPEGGHRVTRGGSWRRIEYYLRCSSRYDIFMYARSYVDVGFRCANAVLSHAKPSASAPTEPNTSSE